MHRENDCLGSRHWFCIAAAVNYQGWGQPTSQSRDKKSTASIMSSNKDSHESERKVLGITRMSENIFNKFETNCVSQLDTRYIYIYIFYSAHLKIPYCGKFFLTAKI